MNLFVQIESAPEGEAIYLGLALSKIDRCTNLKDAQLCIGEMQHIGTYMGANHLAIHAKRGGDIVAPRLALVTERKAPSLAKR